VNQVETCIQFYNAVKEDYLTDVEFSVETLVFRLVLLAQAFAYDNQQNASFERCFDLMVISATTWVLNGS